MTFQELERQLIKIRIREDTLRSMLYTPDGQPIDIYMEVLRDISLDTSIIIDHLYKSLEEEGLERYEERDTPFR